MRKILCKIGVHKWGSVKQWIVDGVHQPARMCLSCGKVKAESKK